MHRRPCVSSRPVCHLRDHGRAGRQPLVHRGQRQQDRPDHARGHDHRVHPVPTGGSQARRDHGRAGRQPLVHRARRQQDRPDHARRGRSPSSPSPPPTATRSGSRPGPTATSGSPSSAATRSAGSRRRARSPSSPCPPRAASPYGITAGPDGNLWFTEADGDQIGRITPAGVDHRVPRRHRPTAVPTGSRPGRTATSGSPRRSGNKIGRITPQGRSPSSPSHHRRQPADRDHGRAGRQPLVHRAGRQPDRPDHARGRRHRVRRRPPPTASPWSDHGRAGRQPLVHRERGQQHRTGPHRRRPGVDNRADCHWARAAGNRADMSGRAMGRLGRTTARAERFDHDTSGVQWLLDGTPIAGATGQTYTPAAADVGHQLSCTVNATYPLLRVTVTASSAGVKILVPHATPPDPKPHAARPRRPPRRRPRRRNRASRPRLTCSSRISLQPARHSPSP